MVFTYSELKEYVKEDFYQFYRDLGFGEQEIYPAEMDDYQQHHDFTKGENICIHIFLAMNYLNNDLNPEKIFIGVNDLLKSKEEIQLDLGEDYDRLLKEIDFIMDKYWRRVEAMSLHELMALYRREKQ